MRTFYLLLLVSVSVSLCVWKHVKCADIFNQNVSHNKNERKQQAKLIAAVSCVTVGVLCWWQNVSANSCPFTLIRSPPDRRIWVLFVSCFCFFNQGSVIYFFYSYSPSYLSRILHILHTHTHIPTDIYSMEIVETTEKKFHSSNSNGALLCMDLCQTFRLFRVRSLAHSFDRSFARSLVRCAKFQFFLSQLNMNKYIFQISVI